MAQKQTIASHFIQSKSMATSFASAWVDALEIDNLSIHIVASGSPTGSFVVNVSPDKASAVALTLSGSPALSGSGDSIILDLNQLPHRYVQVSYLATSGSGTCDGWVTGKSL